MLRHSNRSQYCIIPIFAALVLGCATVLPPISSIPFTDSTAAIVYSEQSLPIGLDRYQRRRISDTEPSGVFSRLPGGAIIAIHSSETSVRSSYSRDGRYMAASPSGVSLVDVRFGRKIDIAIIDVARDSVVSTVRAHVPKYESKDEPHEVPWSAIDDGFFIRSGDTLVKCYPNGTRNVMAHIEDMSQFCVSHAEQRILVRYGDSVGICSVANRSVRGIHDIGKTLGIGMRFLRGISWSPDDGQAAFAVGWTVYTYDVARESLSEHKADGEVFMTEWAGNRELLVVTGHRPSDFAQIRTTTDFKFSLLALEPEQFTTIYQRIDQDPIFVRPHISPSGALILFSDKQLNGPYTIKILTIDGRHMNELWEGTDPRWIRQ